MSIRCSVAQERVVSTKSRGILTISNPFVLSRAGFYHEKRKDHCSSGRGLEGDRPLFFRKGTSSEEDGQLFFRKGAKEA